MTELISQPKALKRLSITAMTLWRWRHRPELAFPQQIKVGDRAFYRTDELEAWIKDHGPGGSKIDEAQS